MSKIKNNCQLVKKFIVIPVMVFCLLLSAGCDFIMYEGEVDLDALIEAEETTETEEIAEVTELETETESEIEEETVEETEEKKEPRVIHLCAIGDMLMHPGVSGYAFQKDGSINYDFIFKPIKKEIKEADIAIVNNEAPFGGDQYGLRDYPAFNVYSQLGDAEVKAGFDVILNANNHVMDQRLSGVQSTIDFWKKYPEMTILGIHETKEDQKVLKIVEIDGYKIAMFNYTYGINHSGLPEDKAYMVDLMQEQNRKKIAKELKRAEEEADFTIVFPHWGEEYHLRETRNQREWAEFFTENGADLIIGTHPHCLEPIKEVVSENGNTSVCFYSLGNYISLQDEMISILGGLANVELLADETGVHITDYSMTHLVTYYESKYTFAYVTKLEDFTKDMMRNHGIRTNKLPGNGFNEYYPPRIETFQQIIDEVNGDRHLTVDPGVAQGPYFQRLKEQEEKKKASEESSSETSASNSGTKTEVPVETTKSEVVETTASESPTNSETESSETPTQGEETEVETSEEPEASGE